MTRIGSRVAIASLLAVCALIFTTCKKQSPEVQQMVQQIAGTWVNKQPGSYYTTVVVLELNVNDRYTKTTYGEVNGVRQPMFIHRYTADVMVTDNEEMIEKMKAEGYERAVETGRFTVSVEEGSRRITMDKDNPTDQEVQAGKDVETFNLTTMPERNQIQIGPRTYRRESETQ